MYGGAFTVHKEAIMRRFILLLSIAITVAAFVACVACSSPRDDGSVKPPVVRVHDWCKWQSDGDDTHTRTCNECDATETVAHLWNAWHEYGESHVRECTDCGARQVGEHEYELVHVRDATCEADGEDENVCTYCGRKQKIPIAAIGHAWSYSSADGDTHLRKCDACKTEQTLAHEFGAWKDNGQTEHVRKCERCGYAATAAHEFGEYKSDGSKTHSQSCKACGKTVTVDHDRSECTYYSAGFHEYTCTVCGEKEREPHGFSAVGDFVCTACDFAPFTTKLEFELAPGGDSYIVAGIGEATDAVIKLPPRYNGKPVTAVKDHAFYGNESITEIRVHTNIASIGEGAFDGCSGLTTVTVNGTLAEIASYTFARCEKLTAVNIPSSVKAIGEYAFYQCLSLESISIPQGVTSIGCHAFQDCSKLKSVALPDGITSVGEFTFENCKALTNVVLPKAVTYIGDGAFGGCEKLDTVEIPKSVEYIGRYAFYECAALRIIEFKGTKAEWTAINKEAGEPWDAYTGNYIVKCTDGDLTKQ